MEMLKCNICQSEKDKQVLRNGERIILKKCRGCNTISLESFPDANRIEEMYSDEYYRKLINADPITELRYRQLLKRISNYRPYGRLLEVGCGTGLFLKTAQSAGWEVTGVDISESAVCWCKENLGLDVTCAELPELKFPDESFDVITVLEVIEHVKRPIEYLQDVHRILRKEGILVISTPNFNSLSRIILKEQWSGLNPSHLFYFTPSTIHTVLKKSGFANIEIETRNIAISEIRAKLKQGSSANRGKIAQAGKDLRRRIEKSKSLSVLKKTSNSVLNLLGCGDSIWIFARKA